MTEWLYDTLIWTGLLIALVLVIRRPVAKHFGPRIAYALWAIPFIRLILPPIVLPASMAPQPAPLPTGEPLVTDTSAALQLADGSVPVTITETAGASWSVDPALLTGITLSIWLAGAAIFLAMRFLGYRKMREAMLAEAKDMGNTGGVRLVETPAATAPLAFGVLDKVIALPPGFLAMYDRDIRDLAVAHELAHHHGRDLLVNMVMQPLFALHWFNPLGHYGWQALRRDQEAACDARVVEHSPVKRRADYARVIASFAAGPNVALAAPMACPVLGEKSIIERLRSLNMSKDTSRRRMAGRVMLAGALIALPLTATVSYAENQTVEEAFADQAEPPAPPAPPVPPVAPDAPLPPDAPVPPEAPEAPPAPDVEIEADSDRQVWREVHEQKLADGKVKRTEKVYVAAGNKKLSEKEKKRIRAEVRRSLDESKHARAEAMREVEIALAEVGDIRKITEEALADVKVDLESLDGHKTSVKMKCEGDDIATHKTKADGSNVVWLCKSKVMAEALSGLKEARAEIARETDMDPGIRDQVLRALDEQIKNWNVS